MKIIEKIEIKHFRSFDGGKLQPKVEILDINDVNIFSGANDSGKSNILRALNLFFNDEIAPGINFDINRDLSIIQTIRSNKIAKEKRDAGKKDVRQKDLWVKIKIHFSKNDEGMLPRKFFVEKTWDKNGHHDKRNSNITTRYLKENKTKLNPNRKNALEGQLTQFLNRIQFEYIPTIKDRNFFNYLFSKLQTYLFEKEGGKGNKFKRASEDFNTILKDETVNLFEEFKKSSGVQANFKIPSTLIDFFRTLSVMTENDISLFDRGDGVQARFIPEILNEISLNSSKKIIWGFEEPENSYESKNIRRLRDDFLNKYSDTKQIFLTTHSKELLSSEGENVSIYRVFMTSSHASQIDKYVKGEGFNKEIIQEKFWGENENKKSSVDESTLIEIYNDLGIVEDARIIEELQEKLSNQEKIINESKLSSEEKEKIQSKLNNKIREYLEKLNIAEMEIEQYKKPSIFLEDEYLEIYKIAWLKINNISCDENNFQDIFKIKAPFSFASKNGSKNLNQFLDSPGIAEWDGKKVLGIFDFDDAFTQFDGLHKDRWNDIEGDEQKGLFRSRKNQNYFYAMLLPVPPHRLSYASKQLKNRSLLEIELYFPDSILSKLNSLKDQPIAGGSPIKIFKGRKSVFFKKIFSLTNNDFKDFILLFDKIKELFPI